jgi:hypothetical protein
MEAEANLNIAIQSNTAANRYEKEEVGADLNYAFQSK